MTADLWDVRDRARVIIPKEKAPGAIHDPITDKDLDEYERAYMQMPANLRARYDRCMSTIDVIRRMVTKRMTRERLHIR